jgi:phage-related protein
MKTDEPQTQYVRTIIRTPEFDEFFMTLPPKVKIKFSYVMNVVATIYNVSTKFVKHLEKTDLYEMRISVGTNEYRTILFAIDNESFIEAKNILLLNGFVKKDNKDYRKQIDIAIAILEKLEL